MKIHQRKIIFISEKTPFISENKLLASEPFIFISETTITRVYKSTPFPTPFHIYIKKELSTVRTRRNGLSFCVFPGYRWCGPGCSGPGAPINDVDNCCYRHDRCLSKGIPPCDCDKQFMDCLRSKINPRTQKGRNAHLMYNFMRLKTSFTCGWRYKDR
jgi:hypothetical protein